jgi:hypothetical protein
MNSGRFQDAITRIDAANAQDPHGIELPYAQRLSGGSNGSRPMRRKNCAWPRARNIFAAG